MNITFWQTMSRGQFVNWRAWFRLCLPQRICRRPPWAAHGSRVWNCTGTRDRTGRDDFYDCPAGPRCAVDPNRRSDAFRTRFACG
jgi:hypothetical protein